MPALPLTLAESQLEDLVADCYADPLAFVLAMWPWGEEGTRLEKETGPDTWQRDALIEIGQAVKDRAFNGTDPVMAIRKAISSGHGIGKTTFLAWIVVWIMATRPNAKGSVTAQTIHQLRTKTWSAIAAWLKESLVAHWFVLNEDRMYRIGAKESWFCAPQSSAPENAGAFAGQHEKQSTSFYIFDEASEIEQPVYTFAEGGLTDGEPMFFQFGNCVRSHGPFFESVFGKMRGIWSPVIVDSRTSKISNKAQIAQWLELHGEDSDFFKVRVRGLAPAASDLQFISTALVQAAQLRPPHVFPDDPLVCGLDVARGGVDNNVFRFRRGMDARSIPSIRIPGEQSRDSMRLVTVAADILGRLFNGRKITTMFVDGTGIGGPIVDRLHQLGHMNVIEVQFGAEAPDPKMANMRAFMWARMREWMPRGCIDVHPDLQTDLTEPQYGHDRRDRLVLESKDDMKARGLASPDDGDALALTFAATVMASAESVQPAPVVRRSAFG